MVLLLHFCAEFLQIFQTFNTSQATIRHVIIDKV